MRRVGFVVWIAMIAPACTDWPLWAQDPDLGGQQVEAPDDPRTLVAVDWDRIEEPEATDDPTLASEEPLTAGDGVLVTGTLAGTGWYDLAVPETFDGDDCESSGSRSPFEEGDWLGDVDFYRRVASEDGTLCVEVEVDPASYGWDLMLVAVDACGVPMAFVGDDPEAPLGFGLGGAGDHWAIPIATDERYAVLLAAYFPNDPEAEVDYRLGISLVPPTDGAPLCPVLPGASP